MRALFLALAALFISAAPIDIEASQKLVKIGDFKIDAAGLQGGFLLDDGNIYKPLSHFQRKKTRDWQLGDTIIVLTGHHSNKFLLVNSRTNQKVNAKVISFTDSSSS